MNAAQVEQIERNVERAVSLLFGGALGAATYLLLAATPLVGWPLACSLCVGVLAALACGRLLGAFSHRRPQFTVPVFDVRELDGFGVDELLLTDAERLNVEPAELVLADDDRLDRAGQQSEPLLLDDILAEIGPNSRVVRLFDTTQMPTPGQLRSRIEGHLGEPRRQPPIPDASAALSEALAELRRSLR